MAQLEVLVGMASRGIEMTARDKRTCCNQETLGHQDAHGFDRLRLLTPRGIHMNLGRALGARSSVQEHVRMYLPMHSNLIKGSATYVTVG
jgi:hypothetical protein